MKNAKPTAEPLSETVVAYGVKITRDDGTAFFASGGAKYGNMSCAIFHQLKDARRFARELREHVRRAKAVKIQVITAEL